ncbi:MAG: ABC transporter ATP-binding protein [Pseudomonadota bacterium]|nr:ABC transporter ATP-binding protein [Pseudomonadota bacterium]
MNPANWINHKEKAKGRPPSSVLSFFYWALRGSFPVLILSGLVSIITGLIEVSAVVLLGLLIDAALASSVDNPISNQVLLLALGLSFFLIIRPLVFGAFSYTQTVIVSPNIFNLILSRLHRWTLGQSVTFFENDFAGRIAQKEMQTARAATDVVIEIIHTILLALASVVGAALMLTTVNLTLSLGLIVWLIGYILLIRYFMPKIRQRSREKAGARALVTGQIVDTVTNIKTVKLFAHDKKEDDSAIDAMDNFRVFSIHYGVIAAWFRFCLNGLSGILPIMLVGGSLYYWNMGNVSAGDIAAAGAISLRLSQMTGWVSFTLMTLYANLGEVEDGVKTLSTPYALGDKDRATDLLVSKGSIQFKNVSFTYGKNISAVKNISLSITPGEKIGLVGASGAGKSTLVSLLLRLYEPQKGSVFVDDIDINDITQSSLRKQIAMVTQETALFNRSARDNIMYGNPNATDKELIRATRQAEAHDFILDLEDHKGRKGYDAHLGEQGVKLSGGQRQRIALARAILKDSPVLVLDEATSALDSDVESSIQNALELVMENKTVLAIAHRLSTLAKMDRIIVLNDGQIVEEGTHKNLIKFNGLYRQYWDKQSGGFITTEQAAE